MHFVAGNEEVEVLFGEAVNSRGVNERGELSPGSKILISRNTSLRKISIPRRQNIDLAR